jgi:hypothetical protein
MKAINKIGLVLLVAALVIMTGCNKNYYSGTGKGGGNCGCPSTK